MTFSICSMNGHSGQLVLLLLAQFPARLHNMQLFIFFLVHIHIHTNGKVFMRNVRYRMCYVPWAVASHKYGHTCLHIRRTYNICVSVIESVRAHSNTRVHGPQSQTITSHMPLWTSCCMERISAFLLFITHAHTHSVSYMRKVCISNISSIMHI